MVLLDDKDGSYQYSVSLKFGYVLPFSFRYSKMDELREAVDELLLSPLCAGGCKFTVSYAKD